MTLFLLSGGFYSSSPPACCFWYMWLLPSVFGRNNTSAVLPHLWLRPSCHALPLPGMRHSPFKGFIVKRLLFNLLAGASLLLCVATGLADVASHDSNLGHRVHFATTDKGPKLVDGVIEFGSLGTPQPFIPTKRSLGLGFSWDGPYEYSQAATTHKYHDIGDNFARSVVWEVGGIRATVGRIIPPWGWQGGPAVAEGVPTIAIPYKQYDFPIAYLIPLFAIAPALWLKKSLRQSRRFSSGLCPACGYDLRATPDRCPECGAIPAVKV
jgi:hypothetical protein